MEKQINVPELILQQLDTSLSQKTAIEAKAVGYLTIVALLLSILPNFFDTNSLVCKILISLGLLVLLFCAFLLFPKSVSNFKVEELMKIFENPTKTDDTYIVKGAMIIISKNEKTLSFMDRCNKIAAFLLALFITAVIISFILLFEGVI